MTRRIDRINHTLQRELGILVAESLSDPRLAMMTSVTAVDCSPDLSVARVSVSVMGDPEERASSVQALESASGLLRRALQDRVHIRHVPKLVFRLDQTLEAGADMLALIERVAREDRRREAE